MYRIEVNNSKYISPNEVTLRMLAYCKSLEGTQPLVKVPTLEEAIKYLEKLGMKVTKVE